MINNVKLNQMENTIRDRELAETIIIYALKGITCLNDVGRTSTGIYISSKHHTLVIEEFFNTFTLKRFDGTIVSSGTMTEADMMSDEFFDSIYTFTTNCNENSLVIHRLISLFVSIHMYDIEADDFGSLFEEHQLTFIYPQAAIDDNTVNDEGLSQLIHVGIKVMLNTDEE